MKTYKDWLEKYYPVPADQVDKEDALEHSIRKWSGLSPEILKEYQLYKSEYEIDSLFSKHSDLSDFYFEIDAGTCALCEVFYTEDNYCKECPLSIVRDDWPCDKKRYDEEIAPYIEFIDTGNPEPMFLWLLKARKVKQELTKETI